MRSLIEPPGFWDSSLRKSWQGPVSSRCTGSSGVLPMRSSTAGRASSGGRAVMKANGPLRAGRSVQVSQAKKPGFVRQRRFPHELLRISRKAGEQAHAECVVGKGLCVS
mmetsp:Transcript_100841/g.280993  ORF Transcript_100841/g.280993 Transcript_100841/m.280993 type:complete len:109 (+) Transcript_100841:356-682(+)